MRLRHRSASGAASHDFFAREDWSLADIMQLSREAANRNNKPLQQQANRNMTETDAPCPADGPCFVDLFNLALVEARQVGPKPYIPNPKP